MTPSTVTPLRPNAFGAPYNVFDAHAVRILPNPDIATRTAGRRGRFSGLSFPVLPDPESYSEKIAGVPHLELRVMRPEGAKADWFFTHRANAVTAVHVICVRQTGRGEKSLRFIVQKSPPYGGAPVVQLVAGLCGDNGSGESPEQAAAREIWEETGLKPVAVKLAATVPLASSAGMTTELKCYAICYVDGEPGALDGDAEESASIVGAFDVPLATFMDSRRFVVWMAEEQAKGRLIENDVLAARAFCDQI